MGIKGEVGDGFPQPKQAFIVQIDWDPENVHILGPTTHPKNQLRYVNFHGSMKAVHGSDLPPFEADIVDGGAWLQEEHLPSGEIWVKVEHSALLRVTEPSGGSVDPEMETGLIRMTWNGVGIAPEIQALLKKDQVEGPQGACDSAAPTTPCAVAAYLHNPWKIHADIALWLVGSISFTTGDPRYKFLEHAVYVGKHRWVYTPPENVGGKPQFRVEHRISYVAA